MDKTIKISKVHFEMLVASAKRNRLKPEQLLEELIQSSFNSK